MLDDTLRIKYTDDYKQLGLISIVEIGLHKGKIVLTVFQGKYVLLVW